MKKRTRKPRAIVLEEVLQYLETVKAIVKNRLLSKQRMTLAEFVKSTSAQFGDRHYVLPFSEPILIREEEREHDRAKLTQVSDAITDLQNGQTEKAVVLLEKHPMLPFENLPRGQGVMAGNHTDPKSCLIRGNAYREAGKRVSEWIAVLSS